MFNIVSQFITLKKESRFVKIHLFSFTVDLTF